MTDKHYDNLQTLFQSMLSMKCKEGDKTVAQKVAYRVGAGDERNEIASDLTRTFAELFDWPKTDYMTLKESGHLFYVRIMAISYLYRAEAIIPGYYGQGVKEAKRNSLDFLSEPDEVRKEEFAPADSPAEW